MKVILLRDVKSIGRKYEVKEVNDGFARNGLIGKGSALPATPDNLGRLKAEMDKVAKVTSDRADLMAKGLKNIEGAEIEFSTKANPEGHLFAAIHPRDIAKELEKKTGIKIETAWLDTKGLKTLGAHKIEVKIGNKKGIIVASVKKI